MLFFQAKGIYKPEKIYVKNVNLQQGLSQCVVTDIIQDYKGFIWATTYDGLNRYDGQNLKVYRHNPDDSSSLISSKVFKLTADRRNHLYLKTGNGFSIFDCSVEKTLRPSWISSTKPQWLCERDAQSMWLYTLKTGLSILRTNDFKIDTITTALNHKLKADVLNVYQDDHQVYVVSVLGEVLIYNKQKGVFTLYQPHHTGAIQYTNSGTDKYGNIFFGGTTADLTVFDIHAKTYTLSDLFRRNELIISVKDVVYDKQKDVLFIASYGQGLFVYDYQNDRIQQFKKNESILKLNSNFPESLFVTGDGTLLAGYDGMGFDLFDAHIKQFIPIIKEDKDDLKALKFVRKIVEGNGKDIFIGTSGSGLVKYNRNTEQFEFYNSQNTRNLADNFIIEMIRVGDELFLGYNGSGVGILSLTDLNHKTMLTPGSGSRNISDGTIWSFLHDKQNNLWIGTREQGLNCLNLATRNVVQFTPTNYPEFNANGIRCMFENDSTSLLLGTEKGLFYFDKRSFKLSKLFPFKSTEAVSFNSIKYITRDTKNRIWLGTDGGGIVVMDKHYKLLKNFNSANFLNNSVIYSLIGINDSTFWISTNAGLTKIIWNEQSLQPNGTIKVSNYDALNGLQANEFNTSASLQLSDGSLAFGGLNGINLFHPKDINTTDNLPNTYIHEFKVFENSYYKGTNVAYLDRIDLKHYENSISISFSTLGFVFPERTRYQYRLLGHENQWILADNRNYISYTNLKYGDYEFQVKACNYDGVWNDKYTTLKIHIDTPFYRTWWFILLIAAGISQMILLFYRYRMKQIRDKEEMRIKYNKELAEVEMKALRAQINPHFLFNSLNSINNYILKNDTKKASRYLVKFSQLVRNILNNSSNSYITLQEELQTIELYMLIEGMRFNDQFSYKIENHNDINTANIIIPSLLLQPYVENAIWHGLLHKEGEKLITIRIEGNLNDDFIVVNIIDNGVGRRMAVEMEDQPKHRKSYGMQLGENRLKLMSQQQDKKATVEVIDLYDENNLAIGTQIKIIIPHSYYKTNSSTNI